MNKYLAILLMAGSGTRFSESQNKALLKLNNQYLFLYSLAVFVKDPNCQKIYLVVSKQDLSFVQKIIQEEQIKKEIVYVIGGNTRLASVQNTLKVLKSEQAEITKFVIHDAARPLLKIEDLQKVVADLDYFDATTLSQGCIDSYRYLEQNKLKQLNRDNLYKILTPQGFKINTCDAILEADNKNSEFSDEIAILLTKDFKINHLVVNHPSPKLTYPADLEYLEFLLNKSEVYKIGHSFDFHPFVDGDKITLGGVTIPFTKKLKGWSDADVLYHAVTESIIGALGLGDIGKLYPDNDPKYYQIASAYFLTDIKEKLTSTNYQIQNIDAIIYLEKPNLKNYKEQMAKNIATLLEIPFEKVNIKATTMEEKGLVGKGEGIGAEAVTLIKLS